MNQKDVRKKRLHIAAGIIRYITVIFLANRIGEQGIAYFAAALEVFFVFQICFTESLPDCMAKMIRSRMAKGQYKNADMVNQTALGYSLIAGLAGSVLLYLLSGIFMEKMLRLPEAAMALKILAPAFFLQAVCAALQGYFQGLGTAMPTMISRILTEIFGLFFTVLFGEILYEYGIKVAALLRSEKFAFMYGAAGAAIGLPIAVILALIFLLFMYFGAGRKMQKKKKEGLRLTEDGIEIIRMLLFAMSAPAALHLLLRLPIVTGLGLFAGHTAGETVALAQFGSFYAKALTIIGICISLALMLCTCAENNVIHFIRREEYKTAKIYLTGGLQGILLWASYMTVTCLVFAPGILQFLFGKGQSEETTGCLQTGSLLILLIPVAVYLMHILCGIGKTLTVLAGAGVSFIMFVMTAAIGVCVLKAGIMAVMAALLVFAIVLCVWNGAFILWLFHINLPWLTTVGLPLLSAGVTGLCMFLFRKALAGGTGESVAFFIGAPVGGAVYLILVLVLKCVREKELYAVPGGKILGRAGKFLHLL